VTVILVHASATHVFMAADSCRYDVVLERNIGPVTKLHSGPGYLFAVGGSGIDRTAFAERMKAGLRPGADYSALAAEAAKPLFEENRALAARKAVDIKHLLVSWYATVTEAGCRTLRHELPEDISDDVHGFDCMGPQTEVLRDFAERILVRATDAEGMVALDQWAHGVIAAAAERHPEHVSFPATIGILRLGEPEAAMSRVDDGPSNRLDGRFRVSVASGGDGS
jgi:hypothetical protein